MWGKPTQTQPQTQPRARFVHLKRVRFSPALFLCLLALPATAQTRWQGTLTQTQNGQTASAQIFAQAPDRLRVEIARNDAAGISAQIIVASGDQTLRYEPATKQLFRARFNVLKKWNRDWQLAAGGPANFVFAEAAPGVFTENEGRFLRRDNVLFGGGGENAFYAAAKTPASLYPASVEIGADKRLEKSLDGTQILSANLTLKDGLPSSVTVNSAGETSVFGYDLTPRAEAFPDATWTIDEAQSAVAQEFDLQAPSAYANANDPNDLLNQGLALWGGAGDFVGAQSRFVAASKIANRASGPILASFEMALDARDFGAAQNALDALASLELDAAEIEARRARLALAQRDWDGALSALDKALAAAPASFALQLARAQALLGRADVEGARAVWQSVATAPAPPAARAQAQALLAQTASDNAADLAAARKEAALAILANRALGGEQIEGNRRLALILERVGDDDGARALWSEQEKLAPDAIKNQARAHLMSLAARAGDVAASLAAYNRLRDGLILQTERENATFALFDAWQKSYNRAALGAAIANRAVATRSDDSDLRLALAYQETYGDAESIEKAVNTGLNRSPNAAFWLARRAELTTQSAFPLLTSNRASSARRAQLLDKARADLQRAIEDSTKAGVDGKPSGDGSFYREQLALVSAQSAARLNRSPDYSASFAERKNAAQAVEALLASAPDDPDVLVSAALAMQSFDNSNGAQRALDLTARALATKPGDGERHTLILAARQAMAFAAIRLERFPEAAAQFELLLLEAQTAGEQVGIASNYIGMLEKTGDANAAASVVVRIAGAPWDYSDASGALQALAKRVAVSPLVAPIEAALARDGSGASLLAWSEIATARLTRAQAALQVPGAPGSADAELERATRDLGLAVAALKAARNPMPRYVEARVAAWLAEFGGLDGEAALASLQRAVAIESRAPSLRLTLAQSLPDDAQSATQLELATQLAPVAPEIGRLVSLTTLEAGDSARALAQSAEVYNGAAREPNVGANAFQRVAFARARILWEAGQTSAALEIYNGLALPQWSDIDRAAALLALRQRYTDAQRPEDAGRISEQIRELGLELPTLQRAASFVEDVEN